jgi:cation:H+ antiporter
VQLLRHLPLALLIPIITGVLFLDGALSRVDGVLMLGMFLAWLVAAMIEARKQRGITEEVYALTPSFEGI